MADSTFTYEKWKEIKYRKIIMVQVWKYRENHMGETPKETCIQRMIRVIDRKPNPYKYDFEIKPNDINKYMQDIINYFHSLYFPFNVNEIPPEDRRISALKKIGSTYTLEKPSESDTGESSGSYTSIPAFLVKSYLCERVNEDGEELFHRKSLNQITPQPMQEANMPNQVNSGAVTCLVAVGRPNPVIITPGHSLTQSYDDGYDFGPGSHHSNPSSPLVPKMALTEGSVRRHSRSSKIQLASCPRSSRGKILVSDFGGFEDISAADNKKIEI